MFKFTATRIALVTRLESQPAVGGRLSGTSHDSMMMRQTESDRHESESVLRAGSQSGASEISETRADADEFHLANLQRKKSVATETHTPHTPYAMQASFVLFAILAASAACTHAYLTNPMLRVESEIPSNRRMCLKMSYHDVYLQFTPRSSKTTKSWSTEVKVDSPLKAAVNIDLIARKSLLSKFSSHQTNFTAQGSIESGQFDFSAGIEYHEFVPQKRR